MDKELFITLMEEFIKENLKRGSEMVKVKYLKMEK